MTSLGKLENRCEWGKRMPKVLVTGVAGMIGSHLLDELLPRGYDVVVVVKQGL